MRNAPQSVGVPQASVQQAVNIEDPEPLTASTLAAAGAQKQKQMLGERLFPVIQSWNPKMAGKITGMLLELDNSELLHMLEHREALKAKVEEAVAVLQAYYEKSRSAAELKGHTSNLRITPQPVSVPQTSVQQAVNIEGMEPLTASVLAAASAQVQKQMLGERLFPVIQSWNPGMAGKITGMLLEMDNSELLHMLEHREALKAKVEEAVTVLSST